MNILQPITINGHVFKNRVLFPPLTTGYEDKDGTISEQSRAFYTRLAKGGCRLYRVRRCGTHS